MITWAPHPYLPHEEGIINEIVVARCCRTMSQELGMQYAVSRAARSELAYEVLSTGATADEAKAALLNWRGAA